MRKGLIVLGVLGALAGIVASYRNRAMAENERKFRQRYGD